MTRRAQRDREQESERSDVICKVQCTLDYLKLCADHKNPTGEGIPVNITIMPDFVVDVDGATIHLFNDAVERSDQISPAEIGSRAGRVLSILSYLRDLDDEAFRLNYIAKTSLLGKAVLRERLHCHLFRHGIEPMRFPYLVPADHTRLAILGRESYEDRTASRHIVGPTDASLLKSSELRSHFYEPLRAIRNANAVYFATDSTKQFDELIDIAVLGGSSEKDDSATQVSGQSTRDTGFRFVFIDLAAIYMADCDRERADHHGTPGLARLKEAINKLLIKKAAGNAFARRTSLIVIVKESDPAFEDPVAAVSNLFSKELGLRALKDCVVVYRKSGDREISGNIKRDHNILWCSDGKDVHGIHVDIAARGPAAREGFVAGMILHRAAASGWSMIPRNDRLEFELMQEEVSWAQKLIPYPYNVGAPSGNWAPSDEEWRFLDNNWPLSEAVQHGSALAKLWCEVPSKEGANQLALEVPDRRALLIVNMTKQQKSTGEDGNLSDLPELVHENKMKWYQNVICNEAKLLGGGITDKERKRYVKYLWKIANSKDLLHHPERWGDKIRARVLKVGSWNTLLAMIALGSLRRISRASKDGLRLFKKNLNENVACLMDLDGTLLQSSGLRSMCLKNACLSLLAPQDENADLTEHFPLLRETIWRSRADRNDGNDTITLIQALDQCKELYHACVYKQSELWRLILKHYRYYLGSSPKNFRQVWNHPLSYPVFLWMLKLLSIKKKGTSIPRRAIGRHFSIPSLPGALISKALESSNVKELLRISPEKRIEECKKFLLEWFPIKETGDKDDPYVFTCEKPDQDLRTDYNNILGIETKYRRSFADAVDRHWNVYYEPLRHTRECLSAMLDVLGMRLYVATEGNHDTQLKKMQVLGLDRFFPEMTIMSTGAAASTTNEDLRNVEEKLDRNNALLVSLKELLDKEGSDTDDRFERLKNEVEKEIEHLEVYKEQWKAFEKKEPGNIYPLIVASIMVDKESPFVLMTDLGRLIDMIESKARRIPKTYFAMVGDREINDIMPIIKSCGKVSGDGRLPERDRVTTVRMLTLDHCKEDVYWPTTGRSFYRKAKGDPDAHHVAWTPIQVLLCLARELEWSEAMEYHTIPAIIPGRLSTADGTLKENMVQALIWGQKQREMAFERSANRVGFLVLRSTFRDKEIENKRFVDAVLKRLRGARETRNWVSYEFMFDLTRLVAFEVACVSNSDSKEIAYQVLNAVCQEFEEDLGGDENKSGRARCCAIGLEVLHELANGDDGPQCPPPEEVDYERTVLECVTDVARRRNEKKFRGEWQKRWERKLNHGHTPRH